jgi:hypothetical protein
LQLLPTLQADFRVRLSKVGLLALCEAIIKQFSIEQFRPIEESRCAVERTPLLLQDELMHPDFFNKILEKRASLVTMKWK